MRRDKSSSPNQEQDNNSLHNLHISVCLSGLLGGKTFDKIKTKSLIDPESISRLCTNVHLEWSSMRNDLHRREEIRAALFTEAHNDSVSK